MDKKVDFLEFEWVNNGLLNFGKEIAALYIRIERDKEPIIKYNTGISFVKFEEKIVEFNVEKILEDVVKIPIEEGDYHYNGYDGDSWELTINDKKIKGYLLYPIWLSDVKKLLHFSEIFNYIRNMIREKNNQQKR